MSETAETIVPAPLRLAPETGRDSEWRHVGVREPYRIMERTFYYDQDAAPGQVHLVTASVGYLVGSENRWRYSVGAKIIDGELLEGRTLGFGDVCDPSEARAKAEEVALAFCGRPVLPDPPPPIPNLDLVTQVNTGQTPMDFIKRRLPTVREFAEIVHREDFVLDEGLRATLARVGDDMTYLIEQVEELLGWGTEVAHELEAAQADLVRINTELDAGNASDGHHTHNELYEQRMLYHAHLAQRWYAEGVPIIKSRRHHTGEECYGGGWFIVMIYLPTGQVSQHYRLADWDLFAVEALEVAWMWDGHDAAEGNRRLREALRLMPPSSNMQQRRCSNTALHGPHYYADSRVFWCATVPPTMEGP